MTSLQPKFLLLLVVSLVSAQNVSLYPPLYMKHSPSTPIFVNTTGLTANPLIKALGGDQKLEKRQESTLPTGTCAPGIPCVNGACCGQNGLCGYSPLECSTETCLSNCDATAECGQYASSPDTANCPLNVCCSYFGFCGTTDDFCNTDNSTTSSTPCQEGYGSCGKVTEPSCSGASTRGRSIAYYESWSTTRSCDSRKPSDLDLTGLTHINFAFAFFNPTTFEMSQMSPGDAALYSEFTGVKSNYPGLQAYISVGGWSFNDDTNSPNTRTAFSDMVSSSSNRAAFISSLSSFMQTYGFDGVDLDWEYPAATDRGGVAADTANFVSLVKELRSKFGANKGVTATLPSSFWYLQGFDVAGMQDYVNWFNFMSYDIHGTWDSSSKFTGPYLRPHTNWTEIALGLDLLWRAGVDPDKVTLGLGWYGRSFTLVDETCVDPNGICMFSAGGDPGECTASSGTLSNAEIFRIIDEYALEPTYDDDAAVNWIFWDESQWVSYDDGNSMQVKIDRANALCLGGTMIWSIDQDNTNDDSMSDFLGIGPTNGNTAEQTAELKESLAVSTQATAVQTSCYWSFCGEGCDDAYFVVTQAKGEVANNGVDASVNTVCTGTDVQSLCCAPGTTLGTCQWEGWNGVGMQCSAECSNDSAIAIAENTNHYYNDPDTSTFEDQTCNGGYQAYCCLGFVASSTAHTDSLDLIDQTTSSKRGLQERGVASVAGKAARTCLSVAEIAALAIVDAAAAWFTFGASEIAFAVEVAANTVCLALAAAAAVEVAVTAGGSPTVGKPAAIGVASHAMQLRKRPNSGSGSNPKNPKQPKTGGSNAGMMGGRVYPTTSDPVSCDCSVTYTCVYGMVATAGGWDEVCDNQRWGIDKLLHGNSVFHYAPSINSNMYEKASWKPQHAGWQSLAQTGNNARCQVDEFPMGSLQEGRKPNPQACRLVNGPANGRQGTDWQLFLNAVWRPCSDYRVNTCKSPEPPITWAFDGMSGNRVTGQSIPPHFIKYYGFDSQTAGSECWATASFNNPSGNPVVSTVTDHGFRVLNADPMITSAVYGWPQQSYAPAPSWNQLNRPSDIASIQWQKRQEALSILQGEETGADIDCNKCDIFVDEVGREIYHPHWRSHNVYHSPPVITPTADVKENDGVSNAGSTPTQKMPRETGVE